MNGLNTVTLVARYHSLVKSNNDYTLIVTIKDESDCDMTIPISINKSLYEILSDYCNENGILGIKGFISLNENQIQIVATKISTLSSNK